MEADALIYGEKNHSIERELYDLYKILFGKFFFLNLSFFLYEKLGDKQISTFKLKRINMSMNCNLKAKR